MSKFKKYKNCLTFLEETEDGKNYFGSIYFGAAQVDYTEIKKTPEEVYTEAEKLIDKLVVPV